MRIYPPVSEEEALQWLRRQAQAEWQTPDADLDAMLRPLAQAMAAVSAVVVPEEIEPFAL